MNGSLAGVCSLMGTKTVIGDSSSFWGWLGWLEVTGIARRRKLDEACHIFLGCHAGTVKVQSSLF
jgi:hypothetical protein